MTGPLTAAVCYALMLIPNEGIRYGRDINTTVIEHAPTPHYIFNYTDLDSAQAARDVLMGGEDAGQKASRLAYEATPEYAAYKAKEKKEQDARAAATAIRKKAYCKTNTCSADGHEFGWYDLTHSPQSSILTTIGSSVVGTLLPYRSVKIFLSPCGTENQP